MKISSFSIVCLYLSIGLSVSCDRSSHSKEGKNISGEVLSTEVEVPLLPVTRGDVWTYDVNLEIPADVTSAGAAEVDGHHQRVRTYLGKISPAVGLPAVDCFEVTAPVAPIEREFVEIHDDRILMRGSMIMRPETTRPMWLEPAVPFVIAGMKAGSESPLVQDSEGGLSRKLQVIGREKVRVPAGDFPSIRLLTTGNDGEVELRRTTWFAPGIGIVREEKIRYRRGKVIFKEVHELKKLSRVQAKE